MITEHAPTPLPSSTHVHRNNDKGRPVGLLIAVALKLTKFVSITKAALLAASFGAYAVVFSWQFAVLILISLFVHESGHIWAMKRVGMRTKGIYFIPFLGGAAVAERAFPSRRDEVFVAIMGPIWGLALALAVAALYGLTGNALLAAAAGWMAFINLFNLFPVNPLDGGRIVKSVAFSLNSWLGIAVMAAGFVAALAFTFRYGLGLLVFILVIGGVEFFGEIKAHRAGRIGSPPMRLPQVVASLVGYVTLAALLLWLMTAMQQEPGAGLAMQFLRG